MLIVVVLLVALGAVVIYRRTGQRAQNPAAVIVISLVVLVVLVFGLGGLDGGDGGESADPRLAIVSPLDSTAVPNPVSVVLEASDLGDDHLHLIIDDGCFEDRRRIPVDERHRHLSRNQRSATLELSPGRHTICLQLGSRSHRATSQAHKVVITVV